MHTHPDGHANVYAGEQRRRQLTPEQLEVENRRKRVNEAVRLVADVEKLSRANAPASSEGAVTAEDRRIHDAIVAAEERAALDLAYKRQQEEDRNNARQAVDQAIEHPQPVQTEAPAANVPDNVIDASHRFGQQSTEKLTDEQLQARAQQQVARDAISAAFYNVADKRAA